MHIEVLLHMTGKWEKHKSPHFMGVYIDDSPVPSGADVVVSPPNKVLSS